MDCILAIDQGTQSSRAFIYDASARAVASHQEEFKQIYPQKGWCEHDPAVILETIDTCVRGALQAAEVAGKEVRIKAVGITNQRETTLIWRRSTGKPCHNAIVWLDTRTRGISHELERVHGKDALRGITGLPFSTYFSALKVKWMHENVADVRAAIEAGDAMIGTVDSWILYNLTGGCNGGVHVTDVSNASRTCLMHLERQEWSHECLRVFGIPQSALPRIVSNAETYGHMASGPLKGVPICGCLGDQQAALLGQRCTQGHSKSTYGTGCFLLLHTGAQRVASSSGLLSTVAYQLGRDQPVQYALEGSIAIAGMAVAWLRDQLGLIGSASESESVAAAVPDTGGVYFVPAFSGLLAPHWRDDARGTLLGLSQYSNRHHIVRAVLEGIAFQVRDVLAAAAADAGLDVGELRVDGGACSNSLLMQLQADIAQVPVRRPAFRETTSLGAALAAGVAIGLYSAEQIFSDAARLDADSDVFEPAWDRAAADAKYKSWQVAVSRSMGLADLA